MKTKIKNIVLALGADVCGIAGISRFENAPEGYSPVNLYSECKSVISFGVALPKGLSLVDPRLIYGHFNSLSAQLVDEIAFKAAKQIECEFSCAAVPIPCDAPQEYWDKERLHAIGMMSMKHAAAAAGIGTMGKNSILVNPEYGNLITVGAILTNLNLESDAMLENMCIPGCRRCEQSCPVHAIQAGTVIQKLCRNHAYGKTARGFDTVDCNVCRIVCPFSKGTKNK